MKEVRFHLVALSRLNKSRDKSCQESLTRKDELNILNMECGSSAAFKSCLLLPAIIYHKYGDQPNLADFCLTNISKPKHIQFIRLYNCKK